MKMIISLRNKRYASLDRHKEASFRRWDVQEEVKGSDLRMLKLCDSYALKQDQRALQPNKSSFRLLDVLEVGRTLRRYCLPPLSGSNALK